MRHKQPSKYRRLPSVSSGKTIPVKMGDHRRCSGCHRMVAWDGENIKSHLSGGRECSGSFRPPRRQFPGPFVSPKKDAEAEAAYRSSVSEAESMLPDEAFFDD